MNSNDTLIGTAAAAVIAGVDRSSVTRAARNGNLTVAFKLPAGTGSYLFRAEDVHALSLIHI